MSAGILNTTLLDLLAGPKPVWCSAPMVRYSRFAFLRRTFSLMKVGYLSDCCVKSMLNNTIVMIIHYRWGCDVTFSPMITAQEFNLSPKARDANFTTCEG